MRRKRILFYNYFEDWINIYKVGAVSERTIDKYWLAHRHLKKLAPDLELGQITRIEYQKIINEFAETHEKATTMDFHHQLKSSILDAFDDGLIDRDPTRKTVVKGKKPGKKKQKYLSEFELKMLLRHLHLGTEPNLDWLILLVAKTGLRFGEALGLTKEDFDFENQIINISKTWDYKAARGGFKSTKKSSIRKVQLDWKLCMQFNTLLRDL